MKAQVIDYDMNKDVLGQPEGGVVTQEIVNSELGRVDGFRFIISPLSLPVYPRPQRAKQLRSYLSLSKRVSRR